MTLRPLWLIETGDINDWRRSPDLLSSSLTTNPSIKLRVSLTLLLEWVIPLEALSLYGRHYAIRRNFGQSSCSTLYFLCRHFW